MADPGSDLAVHGGDPPHCLNVSLAGRMADGPPLDQTCRPVPADTCCPSPMDEAAACRLKRKRSVAVAKAYSGGMRAVRQIRAARRRGTWPDVRLVRFARPLAKAAERHGSERWTLLAAP